MNGYLRGELKQAGEKRTVSLGKRILEIGFIKKILLAVYKKISETYVSMFPTQSYGLAYPSPLPESI